MLLASEGSTTTLLQALVGERLELRLDELSDSTVGEAYEAARRALGVEKETPVLVRRSALVTASGVEISRNVVVAQGPFTGVVGHVLTSTEPIGRVMNGSRAGHRRILLESGWSTWGDAPCAFKSYLIVEDDQPTIYVFERFNPRFIPTEGYPVVRQRSPNDALVRPPKQPGKDRPPAGTKWTVRKAKWR